MECLCEQKVNVFCGYVFDQYFNLPIIGTVNIDEKLWS